MWCFFSTVNAKKIKKKRNTWSRYFRFLLPLSFCHSTSESAVKKKGKRFFYYMKNVIEKKKEKIEGRLETKKK